MLSECIYTANGGGGTIKDIYRDFVLNGSFTKKELSVYNSRCTLSEGGWINDETNQKIYVYADFTVTSAQIAAQNVDFLDLVGSASSIMPTIYASSVARGDAALTNDDTSDNPKKRFIAHSFNSVVGITLTYNQGVSAQDHYIVYGSWNY